MNYYNKLLSLRQMFGDRPIEIKTNQDTNDFREEGRSVGAPSKFISVREEGGLLKVWRINNPVNQTITGEFLVNSNNEILNFSSNEIFNNRYKSRGDTIYLVDTENGVEKAKQLIEGEMLASIDEAYTQHCQI